MASITIAGKSIGPIGFGMAGLIRGGLTPDQQTSTTENAIATMKAALNAGATLWNAGAIYGTPDFNSIHLLHAYFTRYPEDAARVCISVKGCFDMRARKADNTPAGVAASIDSALRILDGTCQIDIFEAARGDRDVPIEDTVGAIAEYVREGKIGSIGLSECSAETIRRAQKVHPIAAVEVELSLFETKIRTNGVTAACRELAIPIVAYSPLNRGFLSGEIKKFEDFPEGDYRRMFPRYQPEVFNDNIRLVHEVEKVAKAKGCSSVQVAIAWVAAQGKRLGTAVLPIPGASAVKRVEENMKLITLEEAELDEIEDMLKRIEVKGDRFPKAFAHLDSI